MILTITKTGYDVLSTQKQFVHRASIEKAGTCPLTIDIKDGEGTIKASIIFENESDIDQLRKLIEKSSPLTIFREGFNGDTTVKTFVNGKWEIDKF
ncbi:MAG: hypothetical protein Q8N55_00595 [bacterium]|nr:hypothetical protein [bacterium]